MRPRLLCLVLVGLALAGCDPATPGSDGSGDAVTFEAAFTPILAGSGNVFDARDPDPILAAYGDVLITPGYVSLDGGLTWKAPPAPLGNPVLFNGGSRGIASGARGPVRFDLVAGTVTPIPDPPDAQLVYPVALRSRDDALFAMGFPEEVYRYRGGAWTRLSLPAINGQPSVPQSIAVDEASTLYVLLRVTGSPWVDWLAVSEDDGATWAMRSVPRQDGGGVRVLPSGTVLVLGADRGMQRSTDQGRTWQDIRPPAGTGSIPKVQVTPDGVVWYRGYRAADGAPPWTLPIDLASRGFETHSDDKIVANETGGFLIANRIHGVFVAPASGSPLTYAGGFALATTTQRSDDTLDRSESVVVLPDGSAVTSNARFDPASQRWVWTAGSGRISRLPDGRLASQSDCRVRFSADNGRTWGAIAARPTPSDQLICRQDNGVFGLPDGRIVASEGWTFESRSFEERLYTSADGGQRFDLTLTATDVIAAAADGATLYGYNAWYPDGGRGVKADWSGRLALASMPGGGVLFVTNTEPKLLKRWSGGQETTLGSLAGLSTIYGADYVSGVDADSRVYVSCGAPLKQFCRSTRPLR